MKRILAAAAIMVGLSFSGSASAETVLKLGLIQPPNDSIGLAATEFARLVKERTNGEIDIHVHHNGELGGSPQLAEGVRLGTIDIIITGTPYWSRFEPVLNVLDLPYIFDSHEHAHIVADNDIGTELLNRLRKHRVQGLAAYEIGFRNVTNSKGPIRTPEDLKGMKIRVSPNKAHTLAFKLLGANPVAMSFTEVYLALQTGAVDGQENPVHIIATGRLSEVQKYLSLTQHAYSMSLIAMNLGKFDGLTKEQQKILIDTAHETALVQRQMNQDKQQGYLDQLKNDGMEINGGIDPKPFQDIIKDAVWQAFVEDNKDGQAYIDRILAAKPKS